MEEVIPMADWSDHEWKLLIGGELVDGGNGTTPIVNPATEETVGLAPEASVDQALDAARAAQEAFPAWAATPVAERASLLRAVTERLMKLQGDLVPLIISETGATATVGSRMQVPVAIERFERYARDASKNLGIPLPPSPVASTPLAPGALMGAHVNRQPAGAVACISPYNFPLTNIAGKIAPALAVGCTVVIKPAPQDPLAILVLGEILREVGFPPGVVNVVTSVDVAPAVALTETRDIDMVSFTGSTVAGQAIYRAGASTMKRLLLELGGKGAAIVFDDADIDLALTTIGSVWTFHSGQICTAPTRAVVHRSRYQELVDRLAGMAGALAVGDPLSEDTIVGPLISAAQRDRVAAYVGSGAEDGADVVVDGRDPDMERGFYVAPTLLAECTVDMKAVREEIFGPVVVVVPFDDDDEAIAIANSTDFGLYDYVLTADSEKGFRVAGKLRSGNVGINTAQRNMEAPFGGFKMSGVGRDGGDFGLLAYTEMQSVMWPG
jgi:acyl-CoA reductase-like NAD-dependent aldehyde dehydrogenase